MPLPTLTTRCTAHRKIAHRVFEFRLEKPKGFTFQSGQFVLFLVPLIDHPSDVQPRAFSIASTLEEKELLFVAKIKEGGRAGRWISEALKVGDAVKFQGPLGAFLLDRKTAKDYLFLATGSGIAPFRSQILSALSSGDRRRMDLVHGVVNEQELFWTEEFSTIVKQYPNLHIHPVLSEPSPSWRGLQGYVQAAAPEIVGNDFSNTSLSMCGNPIMIKAVKALCETEWHIPKEDVHADEYV